MPLRDHFRPPVSTRSSWEGFHGGWPMTIVQVLSRRLPEDFTAEPQVHLGSAFEIDMSIFESSDGVAPAGSASPASRSWPNGCITQECMKLRTFSVRIRFPSEPLMPLGIGKYLFRVGSSR